MEGPQNVQMNPKKSKKKRPENSGDIVFTKNGALQTIPSMNKRLKNVMEPVIGLKYIWEYRSPSRSVPPHYQCRLCKVSQLLLDMVAHITGWKHRFKYIRQSYPNKLSFDEEFAATDPSMRKEIKVLAAEVEKAEGRGQLKVVLKEPAEIAAFQNMLSARPSGGRGTGLLGPVPTSLGLGGPIGGDFAEPCFPSRNEFMSSFSSAMHNVQCDSPMRRGPSDMGDFSSSGRYSDSVGGPERLMGGSERLGMQRFSNNGLMQMSSDDFRMGPYNEGMSRSFPNDLTINSRIDHMFRDGPKHPETSSTLSTLLRYLDTFRIESEEDAQIVLKVTQKLTDVLMEYRLRSISSVSSLNSASSDSLNRMSNSLRLASRSNDTFSSNISGSLRFFD